MSGRKYSALSKIGKSFKGQKIRNLRLVQELYGHVKSFQNKLRLWEDQLRNGNAYHFNTLLNCGNFDHTSCANEIKLLSTKFASMFEDFRKQEIYLDIFSFPFSFDVDRVPLSLRMELIELQENSKLKIKFKDTLLLELYQKYFQKQKYPQLSAVSRSAGTVWKHILL
jgi:hypothetical protein